jgi:gas vesicle protein
MASKTLLGFIAGISAGAILGVLFAPDKGSSTRDKIAQKTNDLGDSVKESFGDFIDNLKNSVSKTKEQAEDTYDNAKNNLKSKVQESFNQS